jgi:hypothetical protein
MNPETRRVVPVRVAPEQAADAIQVFTKLMGRPRRQAADSGWSSTEMPSTSTSETSP